MTEAERVEVAEAVALVEELGFPALPSFSAALEYLGPRIMGVAHARGRSFASHLVGTCCILRVWRQPESLCLAGLAHSAYATQYFPTAVVPQAERDALKRILGEEAEALVHTFCELDRKALWRTASMEPPTTATRWTDGQPLSATPQVLQWLGVLELANELEQVGFHDPQAAPAVPFLTRLSRRLRAMGVSLPILDALMGLNPAVETRAREAYREAVAAYDTDAPRALAAFDEVIRAAPFAPEPRFLRATLIYEEGDQAQGQEELFRAETSSIALGTSWDKAMSWATSLRSIRNTRALVARDA